jgi:hypothetical protein
VHAGDRADLTIKIKETKVRAVTEPPNQKTSPYAWIYVRVNGKLVYGQPTIKMIVKFLKIV